MDLLTCCQAIHWFDLSKFYQEVDRVLKQQEGALAIIGYHLTGPSPNLPAAKRLEELRDKVCLLFAYLQSWTFAIIRLLSKPYENEVTLTGQNPPLKCC